MITLIPYKQSFKILACIYAIVSAIILHICTILFNLQLKGLYMSSVDTQKMDISGHLILPDGISVIGKDLNVIIFNEAASRITEYPEDEIVGSQIEILFKNRFEEINFIKKSLLKNITYTNLPLKITDRNGNLKSVLASITPIQKDGSALSVLFVFRDTNEMLNLSLEIQKKNLELIDQNNRLDAIFNSNIEGTFTIDLEWNVTSFNSSAEKITGFTREEALQKKCWEIFNSPLCRNGCHMEQTILKGKKMIGNELEIVNKGGNIIPIRVNSGILLNNRNEKIGAVETFIDVSEIKNLSAHLFDIYKYENIIGRNNEIREIISVLENVSQTESSVLITGESGTGKELVARAIHLRGRRSAGPFIAVNCNAYVENLIESELFGHEKGSFTGATEKRIGKFELAQGGTLFLDEIGDLSKTVQTKLLRVLENREFERVGGNKTIKLDARIIAATNKNIAEEISSGRFREDLFYRINVINIHLPPLKERLDDLPLLINHFILKFNKKFNKSIKRFSIQSYNLLLEYNWPGNIRELENAIEHCFILCPEETIEKEHLPKKIKEFALSSKSDFSGRKDSFAGAEKEIILSLLKKNNNNRKETSKELGINPSTLWRKIKRYGIKN